jgi:hypothetical protein
MARRAGPVLVDTNVILACWRFGAWRALAGGYVVETVEDCVTETQTGYQRRRVEDRIDQVELRRSLKAVHAVTDLERARIAILGADLALDHGELSLWAHALAREDGWVLCGPDKASLRLGIRLGFRERLASLERLLSDAGFRPRQPLGLAFTSAWHRTTLEALAMAERSERR